jgi:DNA polymerase III epsilon subunit-like protein
MSLLLIDFEATSVDAKTARILEVGAMIVPSDFSGSGEGVSQLVWESGYPALTPEVERVTHISQDMLTKEGVPLARAVELLGDIVSDEIEFVVAYNSQYDETLFRAEMERTALSMDPKMNYLLQVPWLCAMSDIESNYQFKSWRLMHVALEYGVTVNPKLLHRAIADVELMRLMLQASGAHPQEMYAFQQEPWIYVAAEVKAPWTDGGKSSAEAKSLGFRWQQAGDDRVFEKTWVKRIKSRQWEDLLNKTNLKVREIR